MELYLFFFLGEHVGNYWMEEVKEEAERILRKARRRKRKCGGDVILIN